MGSLLKTSVVAVVVGFLLLLPALAYGAGDRYVLLNMYQFKNCTEGIGFPGRSTRYEGSSENGPNVTFNASVANNSYTFESAILVNYTGDVRSLVACQAGLLCNDTGAIQIPFNLNDTGACSTAGPPGTKFDKFLLFS